MQERVEAQSAPVEKLEKREVPSANAPSMAYRWLMDLSPGRRRVPRMLRAGRMMRSCVAVDTEAPGDWSSSVYKDARTGQ